VTSAQEVAQGYETAYEVTDLGMRIGLRRKEQAV